MSEWVREGKIKHRECITEGLDSAPGAFMGLLKGANFGKQLVSSGLTQLEAAPRPSAYASCNRVAVDGCLSIVHPR